MGQIQSNVGLISGLPIGDIVDKLMALSAKPRDLLTTRNTDLKSRQTAITELIALLYSVKYISDNLGKDGIYGKVSATSSNPDLFSVKTTGTPALGTYLYTPLRRAQNQQLLSSSFKSATDTIGAGKISFRFGNDVEQAVKLSEINGGTGFSRGKILITDRSGQRAEIDLTTAQSMDDVVEAINNNITIDVEAKVVGGRIQLTDNTHQTVSNLRVQEVGSGTTAASLGLAGIDAAADTAQGQNVVYLSRDLYLDALNDGMGVRADAILSDIHYKLHDGTQGEIDLSEIISGGSQVNEEHTLGELMDKINAAAPGKLKVEIAPDGQRLIISDLTTGLDNFEVASINDSKILEDLGLTGAAANGAITGRRILSGAKTVLLSSLDGGNGLGQLGTIDLTDRGGASAVVDLSGAETLEDVIDAINAAPVQITARVNQARNGIELIDTSGVTSGNLIVANGDATNSADKLKIAADIAASSVNSGDLHLQIIGLNTKLSDLNGGAGVAQGRFRVTDSNGDIATINVNDNIQTVGDLLKAINSQPIQVLAEINDTGDGIVIRDAANGMGTLKVAEYGANTARDLNLLGPAKTVDIGGQPTQVVDGSMTRTIDITGTDTLETLRNKINGLGAGVTASVISDGSNTPYRLFLSSNNMGKAGELVLDTSQSAVSFNEMTRAQDALLAIGQFGSTGTGVLVSSHTNDFTEVLAGATITIKDVSNQPVTVEVATSDSDVVINIKTLVDNYNKFHDKLKEDTAYDAQNDKKSVLTGDNVALQLDIDMSDLVSDRYFTGGSVQSLGEIGISLTDDGTLSLDETKLKNALASHRDDIKKLFTAKDTGVSARFAKVIERLGGPDSSLLELRNKAMQDTIDRNQQRIDDMNTLLDSQRTRMLMQFYNMELAISKLQSNLNALSSIQWMLTSNSNNSLFSNNS